MRRTVRPFVKEFKSRSARAAANRIAPLEEAVAEPKPAFLDIAALTPRFDAAAVHHEDGYEAAMKAADLVFGKKVEAEIHIAPASTPATTGRVLPSLIETETFSAPIAEPEAPRRKRGRPRKTASEAPAAEAIVAVERPRPAARRPTSTPAPTPVAPAAVLVAAADRDEADTPRRSRRPIQLRWVLGKELRAGERWKRRLPEAAR